MEIVSMKIMNCAEQTLAVSHGSGDRQSIAYTAAYAEGDRIIISTDTAGLYAIRLDEALPEAVVFISGGSLEFPVPFGDERVCYSPKAFAGRCHLLTVRPATLWETSGCRNLAFNPYDRNTTKNLFPHATANVETRNEAVFAARNAIDGIFENSSHGVYPYSSWGINRDPEAQLRLDFGRPVNIESLKLTLRADFPHDNWWERATVRFSDNSSVTMSLTKTHLPQEIVIEPRTVEWLLLGELIQSEDPSPFPALIQIEVFGTEL